MTSIDPTSDESIGQLHDRLTPGVAYPIAGTDWTIRRAPDWPTPTSTAGSTSQPCPTCRAITNQGGHCPDPWHRPLPSPDVPACRAEYPRLAFVSPNARIIRCGLQAGHPGEHEEDDTEVTWADPPSPDLPATMLTGGDFDPEPDTDGKSVRFMLAPEDLPDLYQAAEDAYDQAIQRKLGNPLGSHGQPRGAIAKIPAFRAAVDRVAELVRAEQTAEIARLRAALDTKTEVARSNLRHVATLCEYQDQLTADLAAMTARAESAEDRYDQVRAEHAVEILRLRAELALQAPGWESPAALQDAYVDVLRRWEAAEDRADRARAVVDAAEAWLDAPVAMEPTYETGYALERAINAHRVLRAHDDVAPGTGPSARVADEPAGVEGRDSATAQGRSGSAA